MQTRRRIALGIGVGGLAATAVGLGFGLRAGSKFDESRDHCDADNICDRQGLELIDSAYTSANVSNVLIGFGVVSIAAAGVLWYVARDDIEPSEERGVKLVPVAGPKHTGVVVRGMF